MPNVSVVVPAYNQGHYLAQAIQSVLDQTYQHFEIIVVDDGSTDNSREIVEAYSDPRIHYIYQENRGLPAARNTGLRNATGQFLTYLDSDDLFLPQKIEVLLCYLENHPDVGLVAGQVIPVDNSGRQIGKTFDTKIPEDSSLLLLGNPITVGSVMLRRYWQQQVGIFDESLRSYEDWEMWLRLARLGCRTGWVPQPVYLYRFHQAQMTRVATQMTRATFQVLDNVFRDPNLPESWRQMCDRAYSNAHLRAAAQAYQAGDLDGAKSGLVEAVRLNPDLTANNGAALADQFAAWTDLPKTSDPLAFLERIYDNLPDSLSDLRRRRQQDLGRAAMALAFDSYHRGDLAAARSAAYRAFRYQPGWLTNRGAVSVLVRSWLRSTAKTQSKTDS